ncbi:hypothetical protein [Candidatus Albibeggiatoa sp. nov. NOAA]|uniref:hypothetical protein n=1 Tax=Candidatus Albibeggiatoa sp. nov. NOAA TaxID=3162724 RepID=UPI0032F55618|nr:hypothetical protein [Thiotrichaceae bacterium]
MAFQTIVTSFGSNGYKKYGRRFLETFIEHWPDTISLVVYHEEQPDFQHPRIEYRSLWDIEYVVPFLDKISQDDRAKGLIEKDGQKMYAYRFDAFKFSRKVFAIYDAVKKHQGILAWVDADVITHSPIPNDFLTSLLPNQCYVAYLGRPNKYSECGFMAFNTMHKSNTLFMEVYRNCYLRLGFYDLAEWHDSFIFDHVMRLIPVPAHNLSPNIHEESSHPFINSVLGNYMDHLKGPQAKTDGRSDDAELVLQKQQSYWQTKT